VRTRRQLKERSSYCFPSFFELTRKQIEQLLLRDFTSCVCVCVCVLEKEKEREFKDDVIIHTPHPFSLA
jgi:hypothetical protein